MEEVNATNCGRQDSLIAFLYGELAEDESQIFRRHLDDCTACTGELRNFQEVRESVVAWRNESLGSVSAPALVPSATIEKPSALEAVRQFFNLAPLWLKGSVAFASILFCLLAVLVVARWQTGSAGPTVVVPKAVETQTNPYSQQQVEAIIAQRVKEELGRMRQAEKESGAPASVSSAGYPPHRHVPSRGQEVATTAKERRPLSKTEREQLAADLRLIQASNENEIDLLDDGINQQVP